MITSRRESAFSTSSSEQWRRRMTVRYPGGKITEDKVQTSRLYVVLLVVNVALYAAFHSPTISTVFMTASLGYVLKDTTMNFKQTFSSMYNWSFTSEILVFIIRRVYTTAFFQDRLREALRDIRAGKDYKPASVEWPPDLIISKMSRREMEDAVKSLLLYPKTRDCDPFLCFLAINLAKRKPSDYDDVPLINPLSEDEDFVIPFNEVLNMKIPDGGLFDPERGARTSIGRFFSKIESNVNLWILNTLQVFEETKHPIFMENIQLAAVLFYYTIRPGLPASSRRFAKFNEERDCKGNPKSIAFAGVGTWRMKAVQWIKNNATETMEATWNCREATAQCIPPKGSVAVIDCCWQSTMTVRKGYLPYGAAAFFDKKKELCGIWNEGEKRMVLPPQSTNEDDEPWRWAQYLWKSSIAYEVFSVGHLLEVHWSPSNTIVQTARYLPLTHPIRRLIKPFTWGSAYINFQALVNLVPEHGAIVRTGAIDLEGVTKHFEHIMENHIHYGSFDKFIHKMGDFPKGYTDEIPMVQDGRIVWAAFEKFVEDYMKIYYDDETAISNKPRVQDDEYLQKLWAEARTARSDKHPLELPELNFVNMKEFFTWAFFWSCGVHNVVASFFPENSLPVSFAGRINSAVRRTCPTKHYQMPVNTWLMQAVVLANTTIDAVPMLIESMRDTADFFGPDKRAIYGKDDHARRVFQHFADELETIADDIDRKNERRGWLTTSCLNPRVLTCSASL